MKIFLSKEDILSIIDKVEIDEVTKSKVVAITNEKEAYEINVYIEGQKEPRNTKCEVSDLFDKYKELLKESGYC
jgi:hypothetical protein